MNTTNILITGANGQLGHEMRNVLANDQRFRAIYTDVAGDNVTRLDITDEAAVEKMVADGDIKYIVNCVAYTAVDAAEDRIAPQRPCRGAAGSCSPAPRSAHGACLDRLCV